MCASSCLCFALEQDFKRARSSLRSVLRPARAANCSGLAVSAKLCVTGHIPAVRNSLTACTWPACTAKSNGVVPSAAVKCALCSSSKRTISWWPECAASCKGLKPSLSHLCSAPASNNILTMSKCPWRAAMWSAVAPSTIGDDGSYEPSAAIRSVPIACEWSVLLMALWRGAVKLGATRKQRLEFDSCLAIWQDSVHGMACSLGFLFTSMWRGVVLSVLLQPSREALLPPKVASSVSLIEVCKAVRGCTSPSEVQSDGGLVTSPISITTSPSPGACCGCIWFGQLRFSTSSPPELRAVMSATTIFKTKPTAVGNCSEITTLH